MGYPASQLYFALVVFVLTPDGKVATIGGRELSEGHIAAVPRRGLNLSAMVKEHMEGLLPPGTITSRIRPLMPRLGRDGVVVLPLWATGRLPEAALWTAALARAEVRPFDALGRLADQLGDHTLVEEAHSEFRRALASDPVSHQLMSEGGRLRALAMDELELVANRHDGIPPVFGLLPERFTIEQLQMAVTQAARLHPGDIQKSSNFRRRLVELTRLGVLERTSGTTASETRGRPPQFYRFNQERWIEWLHARREDSDTGLLRRSGSSFYDGPPRDSVAMMRTPHEHDALPEPMRAHRMPDRSSAARGEGRSDERVERLEDMMRTLMGEIADLRKSAEKPAEKSIERRGDEGDR